MRSFAERVTVREARDLVQSRRRISGENAWVCAQDGLEPFAPLGARGVAGGDSTVIEGHDTVRLEAARSCVSPEGLQGLLVRSEGEAAWEETPDVRDVARFDVSAEDGGEICVLPEAVHAGAVGQVG